MVLSSASSVSTNSRLILLLTVHENVSFLLTNRCYPYQVLLPKETKRHNLCVVKDGSEALFLRFREFSSFGIQNMFALHSFKSL